MGRRLRGGRHPHRSTALARGVNEMNTQRPIAIWDSEEATRFRASSLDTQNKWNAYAEAEARKYNASSSATDRDTNVLHQWAPPLRFSQWLNYNSVSDTSALIKRLIRVVDAVAAGYRIDADENEE